MESISKMTAEMDEHISLLAGRADPEGDRLLS